MSDSKIVQALEKFKADYAWDKSLVNSHTPVPAPAADLGNYSLRDFIEAAQARASGRASHESC